MKVNYYHVNAFSQHAFSGNSAIVCILDQWLDDDLLQIIVLEFNQLIVSFIIHTESETTIR